VVRESLSELEQEQWSKKTGKSYDWVIDVAFITSSEIVW